MPCLSNEKRYRKNSNGFEQEEQFENFSRKSAAKNSLRHWWIKNIYRYLPGWVQCRRCKSWGWISPSVLGTSGHHPGTPD